MYRYFIEDGNEHGNLFRYNLGIQANYHDLLVPADNFAAIFWIGSALNECDFSPLSHFFFVEKLRREERDEGERDSEVGGGESIIEGSDREVICFHTLSRSFEGNVAVAGTHGYWFAMPERPTGFGSSFADYPQQFPRLAGMGKFANNKGSSFSSS